MSDLRALLESIAYGDDSKLTPTDRLRAAELLAAQRVNERRAVDVELAGLDAEDIDRELDGALLVDVCRAVLEDREVLGVRAEDWPQTAHYLRGEVERQVALGIAGASKRQKAIEARAREIAESLNSEAATQARSSIEADGPAEAREAVREPENPAEDYPGLAALRAWDDEPEPHALRRSRRR